MPYAKRTYRRRRPTRSVRRSSAKRSRFSKKKRFVKNNSNMVKINTSVMAKTAYVKLPWTFNEQRSIGATTNYSWTFRGNSIAPQGGNTTGITAGSILPSGCVEYASFYDKYRVLGASLSVQFLTASTSNWVRVILLPVSASDAASDLATIVTEYDTYSYSQLAAMPGAQSRIVGFASGSNAQVFLKAFRKTKHMLGIKDIRDQDELLGDMPSTAGAGGTQPFEEGRQWFYYFRAFNPAGSAVTVEIMAKMKLYVELNNRRAYQQATSS